MNTDLSADRDVSESRAGELWQTRRPRSGLQALVDQIWPIGLDRVHLTLGAPPPGWVAAEQYDVVPRIETARMLIPVRPIAAARALLAYNRLRHPGIRVGKWVTATAILAGRRAQVSRDRLTVCVPAETTPAELAELLLLRHVDAQLGEGPHTAAMGVGEPAPNRKPTVQLFDQHGRPRAFLKVGWNAYTRGLVENEATVLLRLEADTRDQKPSRPEVRFEGHWRGRRLLATAPLPARIKRHPPRRWPDSASMRSVAEQSPVTESRLADSEYAVRLASDVQSLAGTDTLTHEEFHVLATHLDRLLVRHGHQRVRFGAWHGDWSSWNIGRVGAQEWVWDWEHHGTGFPIGLDLMHYAFQRAFLTRGTEVSTALTTARVQIGPHLPELGLPTQDATFLADLYLVELFLRACRMHIAGAGWNQRFRSGALVALGSQP